jgi:hypothetical protein
MNNGKKLNLVLCLLAVNGCATLQALQQPQGPTPEEEERARALDAQQQIAQREQDKPAFYSGKCIMSYPLNCVINQKIDDHHLGLVCSLGGLKPHAILEVDQITPDLLRLGPVNTMVAYYGSKNFQMNNGFEETFDLWKTCQ